MNIGICHLQAVSGSQHRYLKSLAQGKDPLSFDHRCVVLPPFVRQLATHSKRNSSLRGCAIIVPQKAANSPPLFNQDKMEANT